MDFDVNASMYDLLGLDKMDQYIGVGQYIGKRIVNITNVNQLVFSCMYYYNTSYYINGQEMPFVQQQRTRTSRI